MFWELASCWVLCLCGVTSGWLDPGCDKCALLVALPHIDFFSLAPTLHFLGQGEGNLQGLLVLSSLSCEG